MKYVPHKYQEAVIEHILKNQGTGVYLGMGLGKTSTTLSAIFQAMFDEMSINKVLIVAPKKVAEATWQDEAAKWDCFKNVFDNSGNTGTAGTGTCEKSRYLHH